MYIHLKGLKLFAYHGVLPQENKVGAEYTINLSLKTDFSKAAENDRLEDTTDYSKVFDTVKKEMKVPSFSSGAFPSFFLFSSPLSNSASTYFPSL